MDTVNNVYAHQQRQLEIITDEVLSISSNSSICSDFCGFKELQDMDRSLNQKKNYGLKDMQDFRVDATANMNNKRMDAINFNEDKTDRTGAASSDAKKRYFVSEMELLPAEEIFEVNSNSTTDTLRRQRLERNKELRLKETFLTSRNPVKKLMKCTTFPKIRAEENSETSSEFPASSPSNTQMQKKPPQSQRPPMLKNTLPADAFERGLALIAAQNPPMTVYDKIRTWQCTDIEQLSDVEDVVNFEELLMSRQCSTKRLPTRSKTVVAGEPYTNFGEFLQRIANLRAPETRLRGSDLKQKSKFTSEDDEKPTTSNCLMRNRDAPLKKRPSKYKRAAAVDPLSDALIPKKKSSSSGTPKQAIPQQMPNTKKKAHQQQQKIYAATAAGDDAGKALRADSSAASSQALTKNNSKSSSARNTRHVKSNKQSNEIMPAEPTKMTSASSKQIAFTATTPTKEDQDAFFRWRRLSREIDKTPTKNSPIKRELMSAPQPSKGLIQIRYDFMGPNESNDQEMKRPLAYNVVDKILKQENQTSVTEIDVKQNASKPFKTPLGPLQKFKEINQSQKQLKPNSMFEVKQIKSEFIVNDVKPLIELKSKEQTTSKSSTTSGDGGGDNKNNKNTNASIDFSVEFHQQHEFCNYLGLTGMSTANAMANAAAELSKCNIVRRSLRVRKIEIQKAKSTKLKTKPKSTKANDVKANLENVCCSATSIDAQKDEILTSSLSGMMENALPALCDEGLERKIRQANAAVVAALKPPAQLIPTQQQQQTKEREAKIQILCQITASTKKEQEEACKKCVEKITEPIRRTLLEQYKQNGGIAKIMATKGKTDGEADTPKRLTSGNTDDTKFIELTSKKLDRANSVKAEMQTLHDKVQRCLEESRQNAPNIFIVKSLNNLKEQKNPDNRVEKAFPEDAFQVVDDDDEDVVVDAEESQTLSAKLRSKAAVRSKNPRETQSPKDKKLKPTRGGGVGGGMRKSNSNLTATRRLYTRSMLNLNQQRELRNRKVILQLLKTYSGLRIKVTKPKKKSENTNRTNVDAAKSPSTNKSKRNRGRGAHLATTEQEASTQLPISSDETVAKLSVTTLFVNKLLDSSTASAERTSLSNEESVVGTTNDLSMMTPKVCTSSETKAIYENKQMAAAASSQTLTPRNLSAMGVQINQQKDNLADACVQTDLANVTRILQTVCNDTGKPSNLPAKMRNEVDIVSSSDVVTSTTMHIGEHNRPAGDSNHPAAKELYRNFSFTAESNVNSADAVAIAAAAAADAAPSQIRTGSSQLYTERNPLANVSLNSSAENINELGIHALSEPSRALRNPLKTSDGRVLYLYYEDGLLIAVQEALVSFWKYSRILNALTVKLDDDKVNTAAANSNSNPQDLVTEELQSSAATLGFRCTDLEHMSSILISGSEWFYLGERKRLNNDIEIESPFMSRLCFTDSRPVYVEMRCRELLNDFRECNLLSCYVNVYFFNEEEQVPCFHSIQLDSIQSAPNDVIYTTIFDSRYFVLAWPQANVLGKVRSGICKYALTPELDMLATTRDFKAMRHALRSLECLKDGKLLGFGDSQLTVWDHRSGDVLMNYDLSMPLGRNLGTIYYHGLEDGQDNVVIMVQHVSNEVSSELAMVACTISHANPSRRVIKRHRLPTPAFCQIRRAVNNGDHFVITSSTDEEIWISCHDPRQLMFIPAQRSQRFYTKHRTTLIELTHQTLIVDSFSNYLLKITAGIGSCKQRKLPQKSTHVVDDVVKVDDDHDESKTNWTN